MSESSSLLMNLGAEVATAPGVKPMSGQTLAVDGQDGDFANILHSVLPTEPQLTDAQPLVARQLEINPMLFSQLDSASQELLNKDDIDLAAILGGNILPEDEQEIAWQAALAEYDSEDPESPQLVVASGDEENYQLEKLSLEDILSKEETANSASLLDDSQKDAGHAEVPDIRIIDEETDIAEPSDYDGRVAAIGGEKHLNTGPEQHRQAGINEGQKPVNSVQDIMPASTQARQQHTESIIGDKNAQLGDNFQSLEDINNLNKKSKSDITELATARLEPVTDNPANKITGTSASNSNAMMGASAYTAVSGLGNNGVGTHSNSQVIANLTIPPQNPAWGDIIGDKVQWMATQNMQEAKIRLNPPELGLLEVRVQVGNDHQTNISFSTPHSQVRDALETAMPRLREMFGDNGLSLGEVNISHQSMSEHGQAERDPKHSKFAANRNSITDNEVQEIVAPASSVSGGSGMLDLYA